MSNELPNLFGEIDIYLFDQLLKGRFDNCKTILDLGCGSGRNLHYFLRNNCEVHGIDKDVAAIESVKNLSTQLAPNNPTENFQVALVEALPYDDAFFDLVISSAVFHFATDEEHFEQMLHSTWRVLKPGGFSFARLASNIGIENLVTDLGNGKHLLPDGSERFIVNHEMLVKYTEVLKGQQIEPIKTTNVQNLRCMTTWVLRKI